ncbi:MAG: hypothetical protein HYY06_05110 [Deltaproteobacteria bacterium]|nr:hypothetical protein [Deltaproteobacteria bacterium]
MGGLRPPILLVGTQDPRFDLGAAVREAGVRGKVALITAGWQERESEDSELVEDLGGPVVNLRLHERADDVFARDRDLSDAYKKRQRQLRLLNDFYRIRLDHAFEAARAISVRHVDEDLLDEERHVSVEELRHLDRDHLERCVVRQVAFDARWKPAQRPIVAEHRREIAKILASSRAVVLAGGHVASLLNRMKLFGVVDLAAGLPWIAAAGGAMVLTERIFLFHDFPPHGTGIAEVFDVGFGLVKDVVVLPDPRRRIRLDDRQGIARFVQRIAPATCVAMDSGARLWVERGRVVRAFAHRLFQDGTVEPGWTG